MTRPAPPHALTLLEISALIAVVVIWGVNNAAAKVATEHLPPLLTGALRFALAGLCLIPFLRPPFPDRKSLLLIVILGGPIHYGLIYLGFSVANDVSPASVAAKPAPRPTGPPSPLRSLRSPTQSCASFSPR